MGGVTAAGPFTSSVEALDVSQLPGGSSTWTPRANMTLPRGDFAAEALAGGRVIVMGGETSNGSATEFAMHQVRAWSPTRYPCIAYIVSLQCVDQYSFVLCWEAESNSLPEIAVLGTVLTRLSFVSNAVLLRVHGLVQQRR